MSTTVQRGSRYGSTRRRAIFVVFAILTVIAISPPSNAADTIYNITSEGVAIGGYDPVAYVVDRKPQQGDPGIWLQWSGAEWRFATESNRTAFEEDPVRYAPMYGGWCAMAMASGSVVEVDFLRGWSLNNDRLYLNVDAGIKKRWQRGTRRFIPMADVEWPKVQPAILADQVNISRRSVFSEIYQ